MNRSSRHFERDQAKQEKLLGLIALKQTWDEWLSRNPEAMELKGEPIDFTYLDELAAKVNKLRARLA